MYPKKPRLENKDLLRLAEGQRCLLMMAKRCWMSDGSTTVAAHSNFVGSNKGMGVKAHDFHTVWACNLCHDVLDQSHRSYEEKKDAFEKAHEIQIEEWKKIVADPLRKMRDKLAAQWALTNLAH
jgi:hypothetical protein